MVLFVVIIAINPQAAGTPAGVKAVWLALIQEIAWRQSIA